MPNAAIDRLEVNPRIRRLFDRDMPPEAEELPLPEFWTVMPPEQPPERVRDRILEFGRAPR